MARAARRDGLTSLIAGLHGFGTSGVQPSEDTNPFGPHSATPYSTSAPMGSTEAIFVSLVVLSGRALTPDEAIADIAGVEVLGRQVSIVCRDDERFFVQMVAAEGVDRMLGPLRLDGPVRFARVSPDGTTFSTAATDGSPRRHRLQMSSPALPSSRDDARCGHAACLRANSRCRRRLWPGARPPRRRGELNPPA